MDSEQCVNTLQFSIHVAVVGSLPPGTPVNIGSGHGNARLAACMHAQTCTLSPLTQLAGSVIRAVLL